MNYICDIKQTIAKATQQLRTFNISGRQVQEEKLLTEGGFGFIWKVRDTSSGQYYAMKEMRCSTKERLKLAQDEIRILEKLPNHNNIVRYYGSAMYPHENGKLILILMELCSGGSLFELMEQREQTRLRENEILNIIQQVAKGIQGLHQLYPPMAHRDIKIENVLIENGQYKLCDFGSSSSTQVDFSQIHQSNFVDYEEVFEKTTTPMYRPPEIVDPYLRYHVTEKVDVWMLGCVMYTLAYFIHPFLEGQKLAISQAQFNIPDDTRFSEKFNDLIRHMLTPNPKFRPSISDILDIFGQWRHSNQINLNQEAQSIKEKSLDDKREEAQFNSTKQQLKSYNGDIPVEELMRLQNKIKSENAESDSFAAQRQKKLKEQQYMALQQKRRMQAQQAKNQQQKQQTSHQKSVSNDWGFGGGSTSNNQQFNSNSSNNNNNFNQQWGFGSNSGQQQQQQQQQTNNNNNQGGWDNFNWDNKPSQAPTNVSGNIWDVTNNSNQQTTQQQPQQQQQSWDQGWGQQQQQNTTQASSNQQQQNSGWDSAWQTSNNTQQQQQPQQQQNSNWDQGWGSTKQQQQPQQQQVAQQQQQQNQADDLLGLGDSQPQQQQQQQQQKQYDITDLIF